jgi:hypothetical protein
MLAAGARWKKKLATIPVVSAMTMITLLMRREKTMSKPILYFIEEDRLLELLELEHRFICRTQYKDDRFEFFWDMMVESGLDQHVSHKEFVEAVESMTFKELAKLDLELYEEYDNHRFIDDDEEEENYDDED